MSAPFTIFASLLPGEFDGSTPKSIDVLVAGTHDNRSDQRLSFTGSATASIDLGTLPSNTAQAALIQYLTDDSPVAVITLRLNGEVSGGLPISPGGFVVIGLGTITQLDIVHTAACKVRVILLG